MKVDLQKLDQVEFQKRIIEDDQNIWELNKKMDNKDNQIKTIENYIEKYLPIRMQSQISEILSEVIVGKQKAVLEDVEKRKFDELHQALLIDDGFASLKKQMKQMQKDLSEASIDEVNSEDSDSSSH